MTPADLPLSRTKLLAFLKAAYTDPATVDNERRYLYVTGRNSVVNTLIIGVYCGDFDEPAPSKEGFSDLKEMERVWFPNKTANESSKTAPTGSADAEPRSPTMPRGCGNP